MGTRKNGNYNHDNERVELGQGVWYSRETGYIMRDVTDKVSVPEQVQIYDETLYAKDEYHVSLVNTRKYCDTPESEAEVVDAVSNYISARQLDEVNLADGEVYLSQYGDSVTVLATIAVGDDLAGLQDELRGHIPDYEQLLHVTLLRNNPENRGTAIPNQAFLAENAVKISEFGVSIFEDEEKVMAYGSERFAEMTANNSNRVFFSDTDHVSKLVLGKDVALVLPKDANQLDIHAGYPTHQEAWLPMWFVLLSHTQAASADERAYLQQISERVSDTDKDMMQKALIYKAQQFWQEYQADTSNEPRKKYKKLTRMLQDIFLYIDDPASVIGNQQAHLEQSQLYPLVVRANELRQGQGIDTADEFAIAVQAVLESYATQFEPEELQQAYAILQQDVASRDAGEVFVLPNATMEDAKGYEALVSYDLVMADDAHDKDVVSIVDSLESPQFYQMDAKSGAGLANERRIDIIAIPPTLGVWDVVQGGKESYQPISMILATHTVPTTAAGKKVQERLQQQLTPEMVAHHYLGAAEEFLHKNAWGKSFAMRRDNPAVTQIKKAIPLYRVACDLLPRAKYMLSTGQFPAGLENDELFEAAGATSLTDKIASIFERQDATDEELATLYEEVAQALESVFTASDYDLFLENMRTMKQGQWSHFE